ncbi:MAG: aminotransferase class IV [Myxococcota bacterium]
MLDGGAPADEATLQVPVTDRGFLYGEAAFEVMVAEGSRVHALGAHLERLAASCAAIAVPDPRATVRDDLRQLLAASSNDASGRHRLRVVVTAGEGGRLDGAGARPGHRLSSARPLHPYPARLYADGAAVVLRLGHGSVVPGAKLASYAANVAATRSARAEGAHEALLVDADGTVREGATSNVFAVHGDVLRTPPLGAILPGITRGEVLALAGELGLRASEAPLDALRLREADELLLTSTVRGVMPVTRLDGERVGTGLPGPWTERLRAAWEAAWPGRLERP